MMNFLKYSLVSIFKSKKLNDFSGFTLIEVLVGIFIFLIIFLGILGVYQLGLKVVGISKNKSILTAVVVGEIEKVRNLPYKSIGILNSFPNGVLERESLLNRNGVEIKITRRVDYVIDDADGIASPDDQCPYDRKRIEIKAETLSKFSTEVSMTTDIAPENLNQECDVEGGILSVAVFDSLGNMIPSPLIEIKNPETKTTITSATPSDGKHYFPLPSGTYKVVVSKNGYSSDETYGTDEVAIPEKPNISVLGDGQISEISLSIDRLSSFSVETIALIGDDNQQIPIGNVTFNLKGDKIIGYNTEEKPIYKYSYNYTSDSQGSVNISNLEWDNYTFSLISPYGLDLVNTEPNPQPISLSPDSNYNVKIFTRTENAFLLTVLEKDTLNPILAAEVNLSKQDFDKTQYTNSLGQTLFIPLENSSYNLRITAPGYANYEANISISGDKKQTIELERLE